MRTFLLALLLLAMPLSVGSAIVPPVPQAEIQPMTGKWLLARVTAYSPNERGETKYNHRGKRLKGETGCAVPSRTLPDGTNIWIEGVGWRETDDRIPRRSVRKHRRIADRKGINIDIVIDLRYVSPKNLNKKDKGYQWIWIKDYEY